MISSSDETKTATAGVDKIQPPSVAPSDHPDELTQGETERLNLPPKKAERLLVQELVARLDRRITKLESDLYSRDNELKRLRKIEIQHGILSYTRSWQRYLQVFSGLSVIGAGVINIAADKTSSWFVVGIALSVLAAVLLLGSVAVRETSRSAESPN